jgi:hypothetical protein
MYYSQQTLTEVYELGKEIGTPQTLTTTTTTTTTTLNL